MKLAIISDIHGNSIALDRVLEAIDEEGIADIVCLGDLALRGFDPAGSINRIAERGIPCVRGNCEDLVLNGPPMRENAEGLGAIRNEWNMWMSEQVGQAERAFIATLPPFIEIELEGIKLCAYHGSPRSYDDGIRPGTTDDTLESWMAATDAALLVGGHTHGMMLRRWQGRTIFNPGTVGLPFGRMAIESPAIGNWAEYAVVTVERGSVDISFRHLPIATADLTDAVQASGIPHPETWIEGWSGGWPA